MRENQTILVSLRRKVEFNRLELKRLTIFEANGFIGKIQEGTNPEALILKLTHYFSNGRAFDVDDNTGNVVVPADNIDLMQFLD